MTQCDCNDGLVGRLETTRFGGVTKRIYRCHCALGAKHAGDKFLPADGKYRRVYRIPMRPDAPKLFRAAPTRDTRALQAGEKDE
jgi:hypothetical protein